MFAGAEQDRRYRKMHLVDQPLLQILPNCRNATAQAYVPTVRGCLRTLQRFVDATRDEVKSRSPCHRQGLARMVCQYEHRHVVGRLFSPPATPALVRPWPANRSEHVAAHDPGADSIEATCREFVIDARRAPRLADYSLECARRDDPFVQASTALAKRVLEALLRAGAIAIDGHRETADAEFWHVTGRSFCSSFLNASRLSVASAHGFR